MSAARGTVPRLQLDRLLFTTQAVVVLAVLCSVALLLRNGPASPRHVLVIDAGSSGTRMYAYTWLDAEDLSNMPLLEAVPSSAAPHKVPRRAKPGKRAYQRVETEPGLDRYAGDHRGLQAKALGPLLEWAEAVVPASQRGNTPVFLFGTAGLRKLSDEQQTELLEGARRVLAGSAFRFRPSWARIISGADEGVYGWVALNYLKGTLGSANGTLGTLDLGGSSLEVTFAAAAVPDPQDAVNATVLGLSHQLYSHVHHHYGLNDAWDRSVNLLLEEGLPGLEAAGVGDGGQQQHSQQQQQQQQQQAADVEQLQGRSIQAAIESATALDVDPDSIDAAEQHFAQGSIIASVRAANRRQQGVAARPTNSPSASADALSNGQQLQPGRPRLLGEVPVVEHPCLHDGYRQHYSRLSPDGTNLPAPPRVVLLGRPDYNACQLLARATINATAPCSAPFCALGAPQPSADGRKFVALAGFYVVYRFYQLPDTAPLAALETAGRKFCSKNWAEARKDRPEELMLETYCFRAPYAAALLRDGLKLGDATLEIGSGDVGWTLGAALVEAYRAASHHPKLGTTSSLLTTWSFTIVVVVILVLAVCGTLLRTRQLARQLSRRAGGKPDPNVSIALPDLGFRVHTGITGGLPSPFHQPASSSRTSMHINNRQGVWWPTSARANASPTQLSLPANTTARVRNPSTMDNANSECSNLGLSNPGTGQSDATYTNMYRLGRTRTYSRRSLSTTFSDFE